MRSAASVDTRLPCARNDSNTSQFIYSTGGNFFLGDYLFTMRFTHVVLAAAFAAVADAHFQLQYPSPRGPFVEDSEVSFCGRYHNMLSLSDGHLITIVVDGYTNAVSNRTAFPISNGIINLNSEHPTWTGSFFTITQKLTRQVNGTFCTAQLELLSPLSRTRLHSLISTLLQGISWSSHTSRQAEKGGTAFRSTSQRLVSPASRMERT